MDTVRPPDIIVLAGGAPVEVAEAPGRPVTVIAADSGVELAMEAGLTVDIAVGDFDSLAPELVDRLDRVAGEVRRFPAAKAATDLELALDVALEVAPRPDDTVLADTGPARVLVVGIEGGRPDHALANLLLAAASPYAALEVEVVLDSGRGWVVRGDLLGTWPMRSIVSVLPVHGDATVSITGVRWPLDRFTLAAGSTRGVSNEALDGPVHLTVHDGVVFCISPHPTEEHP